MELMLVVKAAQSILGANAGWATQSVLGANAGC